MNTASASPSLITGRGAFSEIPSVVGANRTSVLVVASAGTCKRLKLAEMFGVRLSIFSEFHPNPTFEQAIRASRLRVECEAQLVLGIGGGSAMDVAKAARAFTGDPGVATEMLKGRWAPNTDAELVLVPTTAGSGSEVTQFATLYRAGRKISLDNPRVQADAVLVDPALTDSCDAPLTWSCAFDSLAHAVESLWSVRSNDESRACAEAALARVVPILQHAGRIPTEIERDRLMEGATLAGRAINITRTTAAHALAYPLTIHLGVPHGMACAMNLIWLGKLIECSRFSDVVEGGWTTLELAIRTIRRLLMAGRRDLGATVSDLMVARGLSPQWPVTSKVGIVDRILSEGLSSPRLAGTPINLDPRLVRSGVSDLLRLI